MLMIILYSMGMIHLPELIGKIHTDLSGVGIHPPLEHRYTPNARHCPIQDPDRISKALSVFLIQLEYALEGRSCTLEWEYREGILSVSLLGTLPAGMDALFSRTRTSLHCLGGTLTLEHGSCFLAIPLSGIKPSDSLTPEQGNPIFDPAVLHQACPDEEYSQQLMEEFLSHNKTLLLELEHLITQGEDLVKIHRLVHSIKGGGLNIGAFRLAQVARWMEQQAKVGSREGLLEALHQLREEVKRLESAYREYYGRKANPTS